MEAISVTEEPRTLHGKVRGAFDDAIEDAVGGLGQGQSATDAECANLKERTCVGRDALDVVDPGDIEADIVTNVRSGDRRLRGNGNEFNPSRRGLEV